MVHSNQRSLVLVLSKGSGSLERYFISPAMFKHPAAASSLFAGRRASRPVFGSIALQDGVPEESALLTELQRGAGLAPTIFNRNWKLLPAMRRSRYRQRCLSSFSYCFSTHHQSDFPRNLGHGGNRRHRNLLTP